MKNLQEERALAIAKYIIENNATIKQTAKHFNISKSTVYKDVTERLKKFDEVIYNDVKKIFEQKELERIMNEGLIKGYSPEENLVASPPIIRKPTK